jgi:hypothetical protein
MENNEEVKGFFTAIMAKIDKVFKVKNMVVKDVTGAEIEFERTEGTPAVGDKVIKPTEGEMLMESGETYVIKEGVLTEIKPKEEEATDEVENLKKEIEDLKAKLAESESAKALVETEKAEAVALVSEVKNYASKFNLDIKGFDKEKEAEEDTVESMIEKAREAKLKFKKENK